MLAQEDLEAASRAVDAATAKPATAKAPSKELLARREDLRARVQEKQRHLKVVIDKLRSLQNDVTVLSFSKDTQD